MLGRVAVRLKPRVTEIQYINYRTERVLV
jgi:hypothetical protein